MKDQYFADQRDYLKYGLLRELGRRTGKPVTVCWLRTPDDGGGDGRQTAYLDEPELYREFDPELFDVLAASVRLGRRAMEEAERHGLIPGAWYYNERLSDDRAARALYFEAFHAAAPEHAIVFFDPDNGLDTPSVPKGRKGSSKYLYLDELEHASRTAAACVIYQHFPRRPRLEYIESQLLRLRAVLPAARGVVLATSAVAFFVLAQEDLTDPVVKGAEAVAARWQATARSAAVPICTVRRFGTTCPLSRRQLPSHGSR